MLVDAPDCSQKCSFVEDSVIFSAQSDSYLYFPRDSGRIYHSAAIGR